MYVIPLSNKSDSDIPSAFKHPLIGQYVSKFSRRWTKEICKRLYGNKASPLN